MDFLGIPLEVLTPAGLAGLAVALVLLGKLVPSAQVKNLKEDRDDWKQAYYDEKSLRVKADNQTAELLDGNKTMLGILRAIFVNTEQLVEETGDQDVSQT